MDVKKGDETIGENNIRRCMPAIIWKTACSTPCGGSPSRPQPNATLACTSTPPQRELPVGPAGAQIYRLGGSYGTRCTGTGNA